MRAVYISFSLALAAVLLLALPGAGEAYGPSYKGCHAHGKKLSKKQLRCVVHKAGWSGKQAKVAVAIAQAESSRKPRARSYDGGYGLGLFQVDTRYWSISRRCAFSALCNARYAHNRIYRSMGWSAWASYTVKRSGAYSYCKFLPRKFKRNKHRRCR